MARNLYRRKVRSNEPDLPEVDISEEGNIRSLHLGSPTVQSSMDLDDPTRLVLSYSRSMMAWLLFLQNPKQIVQIGLGGGSFTRWIDYYLPQTKDIVIEINPQVIAVAKSFFELPFESERFEVVQADGAQYIKVFRKSVDVIMVDGFDGVQIVDALVEEDFFQDCKKALSEQGIFITNWWSRDKRYAYFIESLKSVFDGQVLEVPASSHGNIAVMAFKQSPATIDLEKLKKTAQQLTEQYHIEFDAIFSAIKSHNQHNNKQLIF
ncbi:polyamine aminopropyltransferase [Neisseria sp. Ec49-e6-T10]|uniref:polyamine aminopropyltransferase n=1 Tax=Neisseria sp. Ec49-e6-T10 TaxID=3140744 RepID=UPI003EBB1472